MPPKAEGGKGAVSNDAFLAACIKHGKEKLTVNFDSLSKDLNMSAGGAANKFRNIMKQFESEGAAWVNKDPAAAPHPKGKTAAGTKRKAIGKKDEKDDDESDEGEPEEPTKKKARAKGTKTKTAVAVDAANGEDDAGVGEKKPRGRGVKPKTATGNVAPAAGGQKKGGKKQAPKVSEEEPVEEPVIKEEEEGNQADDESDEEGDLAIKPEDNDEDA